MRGLLFFILFPICTSFGQSKVIYTNACSIAAEKIQQCNTPYTLNYIDEKDISRLSQFQSILSVAGIKTGHIKLVTTNEIEFAKYFKVDSVGYIAYNKLSFHNKQEWQFLGVIAHEIGHYINHHNDLCGRKDLEIDADYYIGFLLRRLGASNVGLAYSCLDLFPDSKEEISHPSKDKRIIAIKNGWDNSVNNANLFSFSSQNPRIVWQRKKGKLTVQIDEQQLKPKAWNNNGVFYDENTNSSIQLFNFKKQEKGIGKLVNNRTELTFLRTRGNKFKVYRNGVIVTLSECTEPKWSNKIDIIIRCYDPIIKKPANFFLKDYYYSNYGILMPAFSK